MVAIASAGRLGKPRYGELPGLLSLATGDVKHHPAAFSTVDVLWTLYSRVLRVDPSMHPDRDRFYLSKGHGPHAYYAVLAAHGFFPASWLGRLGTFDSPLGHHPDRMLVPGVELSSGSLGHGLPVAVGAALALRAQGRTKPRLLVLLGDAELDEGSNNEAIALAARLQLDRLTAVVIDNGSSTYGWPDGIERRFTVEGWSGVTVSGRDHAALEEAFAAGAADRPHVVVARVGQK
ncbi:MAG: thiamine pyrophosphate-dependent enzyme [Gaiella sp.]